MIGDYTVRNSRWPVGGGTWVHGFAIYQEIEAVGGPVRAWTQVSLICSSEQELAEELARLGVTTYQDLRS
jgi:hypothetical protein